MAKEKVAPVTTTTSKSKLVGFISRYHLGGLGKSVIWKHGKSTLRNKYVSPAKTMLGDVQWKTFSYPNDFDLGIFDTDKLLKLLAPLSDECTIVIVNGIKGASAMEITDGSMDIHFVLSSMDIIPPPPVERDIPKPDVAVVLTPEFVDKFVKACSALSDAESFILSLGKGSKAEFKIGYASSASNTISITTDVTSEKAITPLTFPTSIFKEIFIANKNSTTMTMEVSDKGLAKLTFESDDFATRYYVLVLDEEKADA